jgi:hypothetical protein
MSEDRVTLDYLAEQQRLIRDEQLLMRDEMLVHGAILRRVDSSQGAILDELRAIHALLARVVDRVRTLEERS